MAAIPNRRSFLAMSATTSLLVGCQRGGSQAGEEDVGAVEDLMREHGIIRRVLVVYRDAATQLRNRPTSIDPVALGSAAQLIRTFGEDYHETKLEEAHVFPAVADAAKRAKVEGALSDIVNDLITQHRRGREITAYILGVTKKPIGAEAAEPLARMLEAFARMYEEHAALEDTVVFPAWKKTLSRGQLREMGDQFEDIERKTFGKDGFDDAVERVGGIEKALGIQLAATTAPPPPSAT